MELKTIRYEELQDHAERDLVKRAMQLSRYEIPDLAGSDPGKYPIQGTLCITEEPVQEYLYAGNAGQLALLTDQWIRKKAISRNIFKKRQEDFLQKYAEVTALRETLQQLQQLCKERQELTSMQDAVKNSLLVSDHERRTIFLKNKIAQRKYLGRELERKQHQSEDIEKKLGHLERQAAQKQAQIKDTENRIATTYAGVFARFLHRREAEAETAANAALKAQAEAFRKEADDLMAEIKEAEKQRRQILEEYASLHSQDERLSEEIGKDERSLERIQKSFDALNERTEAISRCEEKIRQLAANGPLQGYAFAQLTDIGASTERPQCLVNALDALSNAAEDYLKAVLGISEIQKQLVLLRDMLKGEVIEDAQVKANAMKWVLLCIPVLCMSASCVEECGLGELPAALLE
jgi:chromosome segregation ATPase